MSTRFRLAVLCGFIALAFPAGSHASVPYGVAWKASATKLVAPLGGGSWTVTDLHDLASAPDGTIVVTGNASSGSGPAAYVAKITKTGTVVWAAALTDQNGHAVAVSADGTIFIGGSNNGVSGIPFVAAYTSSGTLLWSQTYGGSGTCRGLAVRSDGHPLAVGLGGSDFLRQFNKADGAYTGGWSGPGGATSRAITLNAAGNPFVASYGSTCSDNFISRYAAGNYSVRVDTAVAAGFSCDGFMDIQIGPSGYAYAFGGIDLMGGSGGGAVGLIGVVDAAGALVSELSPNIPTSAGSGDSGSTNVTMTAGALLPSGLTVAAWSHDSTAGITAGSPGAGCGTNGCFNPVWAAELGSVGSVFKARRLLAADGGWLFAVGGNGDGGDGSNDARTCLVALGDAGAKLPDLGKMEIRNNVIRTAAGEKAILVFHGKSGDYVHIGIYGPSGARVGGYADEFQLDADGTGAVTFDGTSTGNGGIKLGSGVYWIATTQGVHARKPVFIITTSVNPQ